MLLIVSFHSLVGEVVEVLTWKKGVAAVKMARSLGPGHRIVTILCDSGTRHLSKFWAKAGNVGGETMASLDEVIGVASQ